VAKGTVIKLVEDVGKSCYTFQRYHIKNVKATRVECDEIWSFCYAKQPNIPEKMNVDETGDMWLWVSMCVDTKLIINWRLGKRSFKDARRFIGDLYYRLANRVQLTTDGLKYYVLAIKQVFGRDVDYGTLVKTYTYNRVENSYRREGKTISIYKNKVIGDPDRRKISTSYIERNNLTIRTHIRRFMRKTNAYSKKFDNHRYAITTFIFSF